MRLAPAAAVDSRLDRAVGRAERQALRTFLEAALRTGAPPLARAILFGSRARGDHDAGSDVDLLLLCALDQDDRDAAARWHGWLARHVSRRTGVELQPWTITLPELRDGRRTPMLVDALGDGITIWPGGARPLRAPFTPADARFCAARLLDWIAEGGEIVARQLRRGHWEAAARRTRDDIVRLASAPLLLAGHTRHRKLGSLRDFDRMFVESGRVSESVRPALRWAARAFPLDGGRGCEDPPVTRRAAATAPQGFHYARHLSDALLPLVDELLDRSVVTPK